VAPAPRAWFDPEPGIAYLDAATYGLPPRPTVEAAERAIRRWQTGAADWVAEWDLVAERSRALFAELIGAAADEIALVPTASVGIGTVAASLPAGAEVVVPADEFASVVLPLLAAERGRGARVREVPVTELAGAIRPETQLVAVSLVRAQSGEVAPLAEIAAAAAEHGARVLVDATQAIPFVPVADHLQGIDYLVCHGYKHLLCPRGVGFLRVRRDRWDDLVPYLANWRSAAPPLGRALGGPLALADSAARFDVSLAWHAWAAAAPSLELLLRWRDEGELARVVAQAARLATALGQRPTGSSIASVPVPDAEAAAASLAAAGIRCAARGGRVRLSPHVWTTDEEIARPVAAVAATL
jgi:selenocysteine lyase/cysteine desulfurase